VDTVICNLSSVICQIPAYHAIAKFRIHGAEGPYRSPSSSRSPSDGYVLDALVTRVGGRHSHAQRAAEPHRQVAVIHPPRSAASGDDEPSFQIEAVPHVLFR